MPYLLRSSRLPAIKVYSFISDEIRVSRCQKNTQKQTKKQNKTKFKPKLEINRVQIVKEVVRTACLLYS